MKPEIPSYHPSKRTFARILKRQIGRVSEIGHVLDLGCGFGDYTLFVSQELNHKVLGLDIDPQICKIAAEVTRGTGVLGIGRYDGKSLPIKNEAFHLVYACEVIEHVPDDSLFLSEIWRTLKERGQLILSTPNASKIPFTKEKYPDHMMHYTTSELKTRLEKSGFRVTATYYREHFLMSVYGYIVVGLAKKIVKKEYYNQSIYTFWRLKKQPILTKILWQLYRFILNPIFSALIIGEFELLKNVEGKSMTLVAEKTIPRDFKESPQYNTHRKNLEL